MNTVKIVLAYHAYLMNNSKNCTREQYERARDQYDRVCRMYLGAA